MYVNTKQRPPRKTATSPRKPVFRALNKNSKKDSTAKANAARKLNALKRKQTLRRQRAKFHSVRCNKEYSKRKSLSGYTSLLRLSSAIRPRATIRLKRVLPRGGRITRVRRTSRLGRNSRRHLRRAKRQRPTARPRKRSRRAMKRIKCLVRSRRIEKRKSIVRYGCRLRQNIRKYQHTLHQKKVLATPTKVRAKLSFAFKRIAWRKEMIRRRRLLDRAAKVLRSPRFMKCTPNKKESLSDSYRDACAKVYKQFVLHNYRLTPTTKFLDIIKNKSTPWLSNDTSPRAYLNKAEKGKARQTTGVTLMRLSRALLMNRLEQKLPAKFTEEKKIEITSDYYPVLRRVRLPYTFSRSDLQKIVVDHMRKKWSRVYSLHPTMKTKQVLGSSKRFFSTSTRLQAHSYFVDMEPEKNDTYITLPPLDGPPWYELELQARLRGIAEDKARKERAEKRAKARAKKKALAAKEELYEDDEYEEEEEDNDDEEEEEQDDDAFDEESPDPEEEGNEDEEDSEEFDDEEERWERLAKIADVQRRSLGKPAPLPVKEVETEKPKRLRAKKAMKKDLPETPSVDEAAPKKRGRPKKTAVPAEEASPTSTETLPKRKPGRPKKETSLNQEVSSEALPTPEKRKPGRPKKAATTAPASLDTTPAPEKRKPGRPKKTNAPEGTEKSTRSSVEKKKSTLSMSEQTRSYTTLSANGRINSMGFKRSFSARVGSKSGKTPIVLSRKKIEIAVEKSRYLGFSRKDLRLERRRARFERNSNRPFLPARWARKVRKVVKRRLRRRLYRSRSRRRPVLRRGIRRRGLRKYYRLPRVRALTADVTWRNQPYFRTVRKLRVPERPVLPSLKKKAERRQSALVEAACDLVRTTLLPSDKLTKNRIKTRNYIEKLAQKAVWINSSAYRRKSNAEIPVLRPKTAERRDTKHILSRSTRPLAQLGKAPMAVEAVRDTKELQSETQALPPARVHRLYGQQRLLRQWLDTGRKVRTPAHLQPKSFISPLQYSRLSPVQKGKISELPSRLLKESIRVRLLRVRRMKRVLHLRLPYHTLRASERFKKGRINNYDLPFQKRVVTTQGKRKIMLPPRIVARADRQRISFKALVRQSRERPYYRSLHRRRVVARMPIKWQERQIFEQVRYRDYKQANRATRKYYNDREERRELWYDLLDSAKRIRQLTLLKNSLLKMGPSDLVAIQTALRATGLTLSCEYIWLLLRNWLEHRTTSAILRRKSLTTGDISGDWQKERKTPRVKRTRLAYVQPSLAARKVRATWHAKSSIEITKANRTMPSWYKQYRINWRRAASPRFGGTAGSRNWPTRQVLRQREALNESLAHIGMPQKRYPDLTPKLLKYRRGTPATIGYARYRRVYRFPSKFNMWWPNLTRPNPYAHPLSRLPLQAKKYSAAHLRVPKNSRVSKRVLLATPPLAPRRVRKDAVKLRTSPTALRTRERYFPKKRIWEDNRWMLLDRPYANRARQARRKNEKHLVAQQKQVSILKKARRTLLKARYTQKVQQKLNAYWESRVLPAFRQEVKTDLSKLTQRENGPLYKRWLRGADRYFKHSRLLRYAPDQRPSGFGLSTPTHRERLRFPASGRIQKTYDRVLHHYSRRMGPSRFRRVAQPRFKAARPSYHLDHQFNLIAHGASRSLRQRRRTALLHNRTYLSPEWRELLRYRATTPLQSTSSTDTLLLPTRFDAPAVVGQSFPTQYGTPAAVGIKHRFAPLPAQVQFRINAAAHRALRPKRKDGLRPYRTALLQAALRRRQKEREFTKLKETISGRWVHNDSVPPPWVRARATRERWKNRQGAGIWSVDSIYGVPHPKGTWKVRALNMIMPKFLKRAPRRSTVMRWGEVLLKETKNLVRNPLIDSLYRTPRIRLAKVRRFRKPRTRRAPWTKRTRTSIRRHFFLSRKHRQAMWKYSKGGLRQRRYRRKRNLKPKMYLRRRHYWKVAKRKDGKLVRIRAYGYLPKTLPISVRAIMSRQALTSRWSQRRRRESLARVLIAARNTVRRSFRKRTTNPKAYATAVRRLRFYRAKYLANQRYLRTSLRRLTKKWNIRKNAVKRYLRNKVRRRAPRRKGKDILEVALAKRNLARIRAKSLTSSLLRQFTRYRAHALKRQLLRKVTRRRRRIRVRARRRFLLWLKPKVGRRRRPRRKLHRLKGRKKWKRRKALARRRRTTIFWAKYRTHRAKQLLQRQDRLSNRRPYLRSLLRPSVWKRRLKKIRKYRLRKRPWIRKIRRKIARKLRKRQTIASCKRRHKVRAMAKQALQRAAARESTLRLRKWRALRRTRARLLLARTRTPLWRHYFRLRSVRRQKRRLLWGRRLQQKKQLLREKYRLSHRTRYLSLQKTKQARLKRRARRVSQNRRLLRLPALPVRVVVTTKEKRKARKAKRMKVKRMRRLIAKKKKKALKPKVLTKKELLAAKKRMDEKKEKQLQQKIRETGRKKRQQKRRRGIRRRIVRRALRARKVNALLSSISRYTRRLPKVTKKLFPERRLRRLRWKRLSAVKEQALKGVTKYTLSAEKNHTRRFVETVSQFSPIAPLTFMKPSNIIIKSAGTILREQEREQEENLKRFQRTAQYTDSITHYTPLLLGKLFDACIRKGPVSTKHGAGLVRSIYWSLRMYLYAKGSDKVLWTIRDQSKEQLKDLRDEMHDLAEEIVVEELARERLRYRFQPSGVLFKTKPLRQFRLDWLRQYFPLKHTVHQTDPDEYKAIPISARKIKMLMPGPGTDTWETYALGASAQKRAHMLYTMEFSPSQPRYETVLKTIERVSMFDEDLATEVFEMQHTEGRALRTSFFTRSFSTVAKRIERREVQFFVNKLPSVLLHETTEEKKSTRYTNLTLRPKMKARVEARSKTMFASSQTGAFDAGALDPRYLRAKSPRNRQYFLRTPKAIGTESDKQVKTIDLIHKFHELRLARRLQHAQTAQWKTPTVQLNTEAASAQEVSTLSPDALGRTTRRFKYNSYIPQESNPATNYLTAVRTDVAARRILSRLSVRQQEEVRKAIPIPPYYPTLTPKKNTMKTIRKETKARMAYHRGIALATGTSRADAAQTLRGKIFSLKSKRPILQYRAANQRYQSALYKRTPLVAAHTLRLRAGRASIAQKRVFHLREYKKARLRALFEMPKYRRYFVNRRKSLAGRKETKEEAAMYRQMKQKLRLTKRALAEAPRGIARYSLAFRAPKGARVYVGRARKLRLLHPAHWQKTTTRHLQRRQTRVIREAGTVEGTNFTIKPGVYKQRSARMLVTPIARRAAREIRINKTQFDRYRPKLWTLLRGKWEKKNRHVRNLLKKTKRWFSIRWKMEPIKKGLAEKARAQWMEKGVWTDTWHRIKRLEWRESDERFFRKGFRNAFTLHPKERRQKPWVEPLMFRRAAYSTIRGEYRRNQFPREQKRLKWLQRMRKMILFRGRTKRYIKGRRWPLLRMYNQRMFRGLFNFRNHSAARRHFRKINRRRPEKCDTGFGRSLKGLSTRMDVVLMDLKIAPTIWWARVLMRFGIMRVNSKWVDETYHLQRGDYIEPDWNKVATFRHFFRRPLRYHELGTDKYKFSLTGIARNFKYLHGLGAIRYLGLPKESDMRRSGRIDTTHFKLFAFCSSQGK